MSEFNEFSHLWNDLPDEERKRMMPFLVQNQLLHIEQDKMKVIEAHKGLIKRMNEQQDFLRGELRYFKRQSGDKG